MPQRVFKWYQRKRIVNINLNILAAGLIAIALAKFPVMWISAWIGEEKKFLISVIAYVLDTTLDVCVYYALHWMANNWNPHGHLPKHAERPKKRRFIHDATRVQAERMALVPLFMIVAMGGMWALQKFGGVSASWAFVIAFVSAMLVTRVVHTLWGMRSGTFRDTVDFMIDDQVQIGRDLAAEQEEAMRMSDPLNQEPRDEETPDKVTR